MEIEELKKFLKDKGAVEFDVMVSRADGKNLTEEVMDELIETYDLGTYEAPNVIGHPPFEDSTPAYGWVKKLFRKGKDLYARSTLLPELIEMIKKGLFKERSIGWWGSKSSGNPFPGKNYLAHVGWLGATPPAIKGMPNIKLSENVDDLKTFTLSEEKEKKLKKEKLMELTQEQLDASIKVRVDEAIKTLSDNHKTELKTLSDERKGVEDEVKTLKADIETKDKEIKTFEEKEFEYEVEKVMLSDLKLKIIPANKDKVSAQLLKMRKLSEQDFKDGVEIFKAQPDILKFGKEGKADGEFDGETLTEDDEDFGLTKEDVKKYGKQVDADSKKEGGE